MHTCICMCMCICICICKFMFGCLTCENHELSRPLKLLVQKSEATEPESISPD